MQEVTISLEKYSALFESALKYQQIVEVIKYNIDNGEIFPVKEDEILMLTGLNHYQDEHIQAIANRAESKIARQEEPDDAEDQTEL